MNLRFWQKPVPVPKPKFTLPKLDMSMTLAKWRDSGTHLSFMRQMFSSDYGRQMLGVFLSEAPQNSLPLPREKLTDVQAHIELGRVRGYAEAIETLTLMTQPVEVHEQLLADYGAKDILREQNNVQPTIN